MFKYRAVIKDKFLPKTRNKNVKAADSLLAHKTALETVHLEKEDIIKIMDEDGNIVYNINKGFIYKY